MFLKSVSNNDDIVQIEKARERQTFRSALKDFGVELISGGNYDEPFVIPSCIIPNGHPILVMKQFMELHEYSPRNVAVKTPVSSNDYIQFVDQKTYAVVSTTCRQACLSTG